MVNKDSMDMNNPYLHVAKIFKLDTISLMGFVIQASKMRVFLHTYVLLLLPLLLIVSSTSGESNNSSLTDIQESAGLPALAYLVLQDGQVKEMQAVGRRRVNETDQVTVNDKWHIGSCGKAMTCTMVARLVEKGLIKWNSTLGEVIGTTHPDFGNVTMAQLLTHTSGLTRDFPISVMAIKPINLDVIREERSRAVLNILRNAPERPPGSAFQYSNVGYTVAGVMAERVTGKQYETLMREEVFGALGMNGYGFGAPGIGNEESQPWGHFKITNGVFDAPNGTVLPIRPGPMADNSQIIAPAGTLHMPLQDWARFARAHLEGGRSGILRQDTFDLLQTPRVDNYAFGWAVFPGMGDIRNKTVLIHDGSNTLWYCQMRLIPEIDTAVLFATNYADIENPFTAFDEIMRRLVIPRFLKDRI